MHCDVYIYLLAKNLSFGLKVAINRRACHFYTNAWCWTHLLEGVWLKPNISSLLKIIVVFHALATVFSRCQHKGVSSLVRGLSISNSRNYGPVGHQGAFSVEWGRMCTCIQSQGDRCVETVSWMRPVLVVRWTKISTKVVHFEHLSFVQLRWPVFSGLF